jgi:cytochrome P450 PksS
MNKLPTVNIASREFKANPYPFYAQLRAEAPVYRTVLPDKQPAWLVTRYADVMAILKDDLHFAKNPVNAKSPEQIKKMPWVPPMFRAFSHNMLDSDSDQHTRLRGLVHKAFTPQLVEHMRNRVETLANELLDNATHLGRMDVIKDYALPIPLTIISEIMGIERADRENFHRWMSTIMELSSTAFPLVGIPNLWAIQRFLRRTTRARRVEPRDDLITALVQAEETGDKLSEDELLAMLLILLIAGHETTVNLIGNGTLALLENPDQMALLRQKPELIKSAIEELLRYVSPVEQATERYAREDITLHGVTIPRGDMVLVVLASANRDETQFSTPDKLDITRENIKHVGFGQGVHYCVGAPLARLEGQIAINMLVQRLPNMRLNAAPETLRWRPTLTVRGLERLPVAVG